MGGGVEADTQRDVRGAGLAVWRLRLTSANDRRWRSDQPALEGIAAW